MSVESIDAMTDFLISLDRLGPHMEAIGKLACAAVELQRWGTTIDLTVHGCTRDEIDSFEGDETYFAPAEDRRRPFWRKRVLLYDGGYDHEHGVEGSVTLTLMTNDEPVPDYAPLDPDEDPNEGLGRGEA